VGHSSTGVDSWDDDPREKAGSGWTHTKRVVLFELANDPESLKLKLVIGPVDKSDGTAVAFREEVFALTERHRHAFPGGMGTLAPRYTTVLSKELLKKKDYGEQAGDQGGVPDKAREALSRAFQHDVPEAVERLKEVFRAQETS
jgi:hypothetical protein